MDFDLEDLVHVEQTYVSEDLENPAYSQLSYRFYDEGYQDGYAHGRIHGLIEGRALGREKGFEMWEELGFYEGFALMWGAILDKQGGRDECVPCFFFPGESCSFVMQPGGEQHKASARPHRAVPEDQPFCGWTV